MILQYFKINSKTTIDDLKKQRNELAKKYHPDKSGNTEIMQKINLEYQKALVRVAKLPDNIKTFELIDQLHGFANEILTKNISKTKLPDDFKKIAVELSGIGINRLAELVKDKLIT